ncbi:MAG: DNA polymerase I [Armatimonadetes bacterium]|nr:DNA polymerase I [Armatimonadota bacterium]MDW8121521.1 DNA polymerase I [Armatimonadota bacterium]
MSESKPLLIVVDGHSLLYRAFFAIPPLTARDGTPTNAVYGFLRMLFRLLRTEKPAYLAVALDSPGPTVRHRLFEGYKATRAKAPDAFRPQVSLLKQILSALGIFVWEKDGYEADDLMGIAVSLARQKNWRVLLVTGDVDALQLVDDNVQVLMPKRGVSQPTLYDLETVIQELGIPPEKIPDFKGLAGDSSDNLPGVPGIGPKTAQELLKRFGSLEEVLANADRVPSQKIRENLIKFADQARLCKQLATINRNLPENGLDLEAFFLKSWSRPSQQAIQLLIRLGMKSLLDEFQGPSSDQEPAVVHGRMITSQREWDSFLKEAKEAGVIGINWDCFDGRIRFVTLAFHNQVALVPAGSLVGTEDKPQRSSPESLFQPQEGGISQDQLRDWLIALLKDPSLVKAAHDWKSLLRSARLISFDPTIGLQPFGFLDTSLMAYLLNPGQSSYDLSSVLAERQMNKRVLIQWKTVDGQREPAVPSESDPICQEAVWLSQAAPILSQEVRQEDLWELYEKVEVPLLFVLADMEEQGVFVDGAYLQRLNKAMAEEARKVEAEIHRLAGEPFNVRSPQQLSDILFKKLNLPRPSRTPHGKLSTAQAVLESLASAHPIAGKILEYRELEKLRSTFVEGLLEAMDQDGRVHTHYDQRGTATGRLASSNPNLQNIPIRSPWGRKIRRAFVAPKGKKLLTADYSQIELRILAHLSQDEGLCEAFAQGRDIHTEAAAGVFKVPADQVTPEMRRKAKILNFGIVYGITPTGLARQLDVPVEEASQVIRRYFERFPKVKEYQERTLQFARQKRYVMTVMKRKRWIPDIDSGDERVREAAERAAINMPVQGTSADIMKMAMVTIWRSLREGPYDAKMTVQVHDELMLEVRKDDLMEVARLVKRKMETAYRLSVPLVVEIKVGDNWAEMEPILG